MEKMEVVIYIFQSCHLLHYFCVLSVLFGFCLWSYTVLPFRVLSLESWRRSTQTILERSVEATGEVSFPFQSVTDDVQLNSSNSANYDIDLGVHNFQVLCRVVILIFCWPTQITPLRLRSRYYFSLLLFTYLVILLPLLPLSISMLKLCAVNPVSFTFFSSPSFSMQWLNIWSPSGLLLTLCPKGTLSSWWGLCSFFLSRVAVFDVVFVNTGCIMRTRSDKEHF